MIQKQSEQVKHYRLSTGYDIETVFGIFNPKHLTSINKLNKGFKTLTPLNECVPYYKNSKFAFRSLDALKCFMFSVCNLNEEDIYELKQEGFEIFELDINTYSSGLSNYYSTFFDDEVDEIREHQIDEYDDSNYKNIPIALVTQSDIEDCEDYYKNVETFFE